MQVGLCFMKMFFDDERDFNARNVVAMALDGFQFSFDMLAVARVIVNRLCTISELQRPAS